MERLLPQNVEAEASVLGSLLIDPEAVSLVADFLHADDFYRDAHRTLYEAIIRLYERHEPADFVTVCHELARENKLEAVGGESYIASLVSLVPTSGNVEHYGRIVERMATLRRLIHAGGQIVASAYTEDDADSVLEQAEQLIFTVRQGHALNRSQTAHIRDALTAYMERLDLLQQRRGGFVGVPTGFSDLDRLLGGLQRSDLIILAARPAVGKTSFALSLAHNTAVKHHSKIGFFSLEMSVDQLVQRLISMESGVDQQRLRSGDLYDSDWDRVFQAVSTLSNITLLIDETASLTPTQMRSKARQWVTEYDGLDLIVVDYLQLMQSAGNGRGSDNRVQVIDEISRQLKVLARELNVPVLALAQLSRAVEARQSKVPQLSDLRECVTGDTRLVDAMTGRWVSISTVEEGMQILGVDNHQRVRPFTVGRVWSTGVKPTYLLTTRTGRQVQATINHPFLTPQGWKCLGQLQVGDVIATALRLPEHGVEREERAERCRLLGYLTGDESYQRHRGSGFISMDAATMRDVCEIVSHHFPDVLVKDKPCPDSQAKQVVFSALYENGYAKPYGNPLCEWLRSLGVLEQHDNTRHIPDYVFEAGVVGAREFLAGYLATDGCVKQCESGDHQGKWEIRFDTVSNELAVDVQALLLRLGIVSSVHSGQYNSKSAQLIYRVEVTSTAENLQRCAQIPVRGKKGELLLLMERTLCRDQTNSGIFGLPREVSMMVADRPGRQVSVPRGTWTGRTWRDQSKRMNREVCRKWAVGMGDAGLSDWATSDLLWEPIRCITPAGDAEVFDITVPGCANFLANGIVAHNSGAIEQNADIVMFIYRDEVYNPETQRKGLADIIVAKHRNGPTGEVCLHFNRNQTRFADLTPQVASDDYFDEDDDE